MIERIIENWLDNASERSYQLPFSYLLIQQGFTVIHITRHCGMEHGKDILALDKEGKLHAYQLKGVNGGRLKLSEWQNGILNQINQLALTPITHPAVSTIEHHTSYLVVNGGIEEEVQAAISAHNDQWTKRGKPEFKIETIVKGQILEWALSAKDKFLPSELKEFKSLLEFYTEEGNGFLDKKNFYSLLNSILTQPTGKAEAKRNISSCALLCSLALSKYMDRENHMAIVEGWSIYIASIMRFAARNNLKDNDYKDEIELADKIIINSLQDLFDDTKNYPDLLISNVIQDAFAYRLRIVLLMGYLAYLGIRALNHDEISISSHDIDAFIQQYKGDIKIWGESAIPYLSNVYWFYRKSNQDTKAEEFLTILLVELSKELNGKNECFTNVYLSAEDTLEIIYKETTKEEDLQAVLSVKHVMEPILHLCVQQGMKDLLQNHWKSISHSIYTDYEFEELDDIFKWRDFNGKEIIRYERSLQEWESLKALASNFKEELIATDLRRFPLFVPLFLMVYPHRFRRNLVMWFNSRI